MVRETRHLWVGNLPENVREDRIRDHFKRYGRVQSVKLLPREKDDEGSGVCATVSFMDIKSASKAHNNEQKLEDRTLTTEYHEPAAIPGSGPPLYSSQRFSHGPPDEISTFERSSHFYERERDRRDGDAYLRRASSTYHVTAAENLRGRTRDRHYRNGPYTPIIESVVSRQPPHHRNVGSAWTYETPSRYPPPATTPDVYSDDRRDLTPVVVVHKKHTKSRSGSSGSNSGSSVSRSRSSSSSSQSGSSSCSSASSSPASDKSCSTHSHHGSLRSGVTLQSAVSTPHTNNSSPAVHSDDRRPLAICVRNLPARSSDTSLKDGLFHEYKKHGKVTWVKVVGQGSDRYALVCFKKPEDVEKALQVSHDKLFFGCKIEVAPYQGYDVDDNEFRPYEAEQDEFHPKATRTLFIGNLEKDITAPDLRKHFDQFGEIIEIDIKKQGSNSSYAFCQYCDIGSVVRAIRTLDGEHLGNNRIKLGFGKSLHTNCVWVDGVAESVTEKYLSLQFSQFGPVSHVAIDRSRGHALVFYDQIAFAQSAVKEMRGVAVRGRKLQVDFASRECQEAFYDHLEKQTGHNTTFDNSLQVSPQGVTTTNVTRGFETPSSSSSSSGGGNGGAGGGSVRYPRFTSQPSVTRTYTRSTSAVSPGASPSTPARSTPRHVTTTPRFDLNLDYLSERRPYRSYEEMAAEDGGGIVTVTVGQGPQDIRHLQKERVALLEQLEDCASSGEEGSSRRRCKHRRSHSGDGSRPGTPLCDERPENLLPVEPRRTPRERPPDPLSLPLPRFATQLLSPRPAPPSPPASPPRPKSTSSDDSEPSPPSPEWEERLRSLDEKYEKWSGSRTVMTKVDATTLKVRHKLLDLDLHELQPSDIVKSVLAKRSVFDEDSKRLENFGEKYEPRGEFVPTRPGFTPLRPRMESPLLHSPSAPKSPASASTPAGAKGLQYPFPSHPPVQPTTSVATTTAAMSIASCSSSSSGINTLSPNPSMESSKSLQTFLTSCVSSVPSIRQFQTPPSQFHAPPKISPPAPTEKKAENVDPRLDRLKNSQKPLQPTNPTERVDPGKKDVLPPTLLKPLKSCLRRDSGDDRRESDGRRRSREEDSKIQVLKSECDRGKEQEVLDKRRSLSDPRRRDSVDSNIDGFRCESASDKLKDRNHKEDRWRRDSTDSSPIKKDTEISDTVKSRLSDSRVSEHPDTLQCSNLSTLNSNLLSQHDDNLRHSQPTDTLEKKKDSIQICPERDRRRGRESTDSCSDSSRLKKVPDSLDIKRELESDTRQRDISMDSNDSSCKKTSEFIERRKDSSQSETVKTMETLDRRKEKSSTNTTQESTKQREKKDHYSKKDKEGEHLENSRHKPSRKSPESTNNQRHKENTKSSLHSDNARLRESSYRRESESSEDNLKNEDKEPENNHQNKSKDSSYRKGVSSHEALHNLVNKLEEINDKKDTDPSYNRHKENNRHLDYSRQKDNDRKRESFFDSLQSFHKEIKREEDAESIKLKSNDFMDTELRHSKQLSCDNTSLRLKDHDRRKDGEKLDSKLKTINDVMESVNSKSSEKSSEKETINQISEWVEEIRKDLESSGFAKSREPTGVDPNVDRKPFDTNHLIEAMKNDELLTHAEIKKEDDFESSYKENDGRKNSDYYDKKRSCDTAEIFRRKELAFKRELNDIDGIKVKDFEKKKDTDFLDSFIHQSGNDKRKEAHDRDIHKESFDFEKKPKSWLDDRSEEKKDEKTKQYVKEFERSKRDYDSDSYENHKDFEIKLNYVDHHEEEALKKDLYKKEKKKERLNSWPAAIGGKRRFSSQDSLDVCSDESKKSKPERRDSKDSCRSSSSSKKSNCEKYNKSFTKLLEEKIKEDKEKELNKKKKEEESFELSKLASKREKKISGERRRDDQKLKIRPKENGITASESEAGSGDDDSKMPKKHSIFDIVDEEPAYISMYDKVKARSTKNMQKQEEEKRQERLKEKFNQLKQSRAKREEKKRSTSYDEDSDSELGGRRSNKLMITSSDEDACSEGDLRTKGRKIMSDTSEDDTHRNLNISRTKPPKINSDDFEPKSRKVMSETSEDDTVRFSIGRIKEVNNHRDDLLPKMRKILSDTSEDDILKRSSISKNKLSRIQSDESEIELGLEERKKNDFVKKTNDYTNSDLFSNISEDPEHPHSDFEKEQTDPQYRNSIDSISDLPRKKSHKKKQKRQKNSEEGEDGSTKRHSSKKDRRKSSHSHDGDDDQTVQVKARKKKNRDNSSKRDGKMEDIFGPLSDDSDKGHGKWNVSQIYGSDSDEERQVVRKREKRRKERKARELDEAGRALEAKLMEPYENLQHLEDHAKSKKKKRKKSREERMNKHHHLRLEEAADRVHEADSEHEPEPSITNIPPPSLPRLMDSPPPSLNQSKKPDIPGFGSQVDENIHETAVKSISESPIKPMEEKQELIEEPPPSNPEDKPTPVISQEETEDAVAALLLEDSFGGSGGFETYTKPDTPVSEPDLQIDTDTEDTFDAIDFSRPPRTPDIPTSFYRQQDTREGLEERILALACPDNSSGKQDEGSSPDSSPKPSQISSSQDSDQENKATKNTKDMKTITQVDTKRETTPESKSKETQDKTVTHFDSVKRHDLPTVCQNEISHSVQPVKVNYSETSTKKLTDQPLPKIIIGKNTNQPEKSSTISQITTKKILSPTPPPLLHTSNVSSKDGTCDLNNPLNVKQTPITESSKTLQIVTTQPNSPAVFSAPAQDVHKTSVQTSDPHLDKTPLTPKPLNQIIVSPPTSVALIVQAQPKLSQTGQQSTVLHMTTKIHSPGNAQVEIKGNSQMSYMIHHNLQQSQAPGSQIGGNRLTAQQPTGQMHPGSHKISVSTAPNLSKSPVLSSSKSPGASGSTKTPIQDPQFKQIVINHPHTQQLSVNVSHSHHVNANLLLSPGHQLNVSHSPALHHSQATLSFSPHHMKVPLAQQHINSMNSNVLQLSPNIHQQVSPLSNNQQKGTQNSPASHQLLSSQHVASNLQLKSSHLLQPVANCVGPAPGKLMSPTSGTKPTTVHNIPGLPVRHLSPVAQQNTVHKINAHVIQSPSNVQQVRTVVLQNQSKQTVTLLQTQVVQRSPGNQIIHPPITTPPQTIQALKVNPPLLIEKHKLSSEASSDSQTVKGDLPQLLPTSESAPKPSEGAILQTVPINENINVSFVNNEIDKDKIESNQKTNKQVEENNILGPVVQDLTCKTSPTKRAPSPIKTKGVSEDANQKLAKPLNEETNETNNIIKSSVLKEPLNMGDKTEPSTDRNPNVDLPPQPTEKNEVSKKDLSSEEISNNSKEGNKDLPTPITSQVSTEDTSSKIKQIPETSKVLSKKEEKPSKPTEELKVEKIRIKKEENGLCIDQTPVKPVKVGTTNLEIDKEQKTEAKELSDKSQNETDETHQGDEASKHPVAEDTSLAVTTPSAGGRGRGGRRRKASGRVGGVVTRRARLNSSVTATSDLASADVYEFRDDSEEEARPRLILTIKSPPDPAAAVAVPSAAAAAPASPPSQTAPASTSNLPQPVCRKSRRLQEKDGSRSTVDDTIEDVIRSTRNGRRTTRATVNRTVSPAPEPRKSPRRKQSVVGLVPAAPAVPVTSVASEATPAPAAEPKNPPTLVVTPPPAPACAVPAKPASTEPMTLIDPVTGLLIPMRESEEGQYIPVNTDHIRPPLESKEESGEPVEKRARTTLPTESEASLLLRPGKVPPNCAVVPPLPPKQSVTPLLKPAGIVAPSGIPRPTTNPLTKPLTINTPPIAAISKASVTNVVGPMTINRVVPPPVSPSGKPAVPNISSTTPLNHKSHLVQAVAHRGKVPVAKVPAPMTPKHHILHSITNVGREGMVGPGTPPPPHHGALLTGSVASPPLRAPHHISQQPVVTGASSTRVVCKGLVEPLKVEPGSCIVVPTASPQSRSQVLQAGLPVPAYEASLHGLVAELLPNPQWPRQSPPPAHQPQGEVVQHVNFPPHHIQPAHYVHPQLVYQQYFREAALTGYHLPPGVKGEVDDRSAGVGSSPPLELRRGSPHDRTTDSPQVATVYVHGSRHLYFEPPPAHRPSQPRLQVATPPHASQVPAQADSLLMLLQRYPVMWQGLLALKTDQAAVQMHFVFGNPHVARDSLPCNSDGTTPPLRIAQRMRLEQTQVEGVARKMQMDNEHCMLLALPCGRDHLDVLQQSNNLQSGFITYLQQKQAAGIVNIAGPGSQQAAYVVHIFPSCDFANESLARIAPDLLHRVANIAHLLIVIATV